MTTLKIHRDPEVADWARTIANEWHNGKSYDLLGDLEQEDCLAEAKAHVKAERGGYEYGDKCPCVSGENSDGSGHEYAAPECDLCNGTGYVGMTEVEEEVA